MTISHLSVPFLCMSTSLGLQKTVVPFLVHFVEKSDPKTYSPVELTARLRSMFSFVPSRVLLASVLMDMDLKLKILYPSDSRLR